MKKTLSLLLLAVATLTGSVNAFAGDKDQVYQTAILKNGTVLYGYILQNDGLGNLLFQSDSAKVLLQDVEADVTDRTVNRGMLSQQWQEWADKNSAWQGTNDNQYLLLSDVTVRKVQAKNDNFANQMVGKVAANVKLLERGVKYRYTEMSGNTYRLKWDDVVNVVSERRPKTALSGINVTCQTKTGQTYTGQYAGETGQITSLYLDNGVIQTLKKDEVVKYSYSAVNPGQSVFEQSPLLDAVRTKNLGTITGVIIEQNYASDKDTENYILLQQASGVIQSVKMSDIENISKERNKQYAPQFDVILEPGQVYINDTPATSVAVKSKKGVNTLPAFTPVVVKKGANDLTQVKVQYSAVTAGTNVEAYRVVALKKTGKGKKAVYSFTDESLASSVYRPVEISTSVNQTTKAVYNLNGAGGFILYDAKAKVAYSIFVEP
ncbi:MAG: hypothetical protein IJ570_00205 [Prevotella sp.]|nr:hypothetical protein [Prevotella sp.]